MNVGTRAPGAVRAAAVADELAIMRLLVAHRNAITDGEIEAYAGTFAPEARLVNSSFDPAIGTIHDGLRRLARRTHA